MPRKIFVCGRQDDSSGVALKLRAALDAEFGRDFLFLGLESILGGKTLDVAVRNEVAASDAVFVLIGPQWAQALYDDGLSRYATPQNAIRVAVSTALEFDKPVFPVVIDGAKMPNPSSLPDDMKAMAYRQALTYVRESDLEHILAAFAEIGSSILGRPVKRMSTKVEADATAPQCIFISYRRNDTSQTARQLYKQLSKRFGTSKVFVDVDSITHGRDFRDILDEYIARSGVVLALIGQRWLDVSADGQRRLDDPDDFVRMELSTALRRDKPVIPILVDAATLPTQAQLPQDLKALPFRHAIFLDREESGRRFSEVESAVRNFVTPKRRWWEHLLSSR
jgi:hypothetical protein